MPATEARSAATKPRPVQPGDQVGSYRLVGRLGQGGWGVVYEAVHVDHGTRVALKLLGGDYGPRAQARFRRETLAVARVRHPHIVAVVESGLHEGQVFLAMEHLEGESLAARLEREGRLPAATAVDLVLPIAAALVAAHAAGVLHRDLKPDNIVLASRAGGLCPTLLDFGLSKLDAAAPGASPLTDSLELAGTPDYMPPEQVRGLKNVDAAGDQYALAAVLYHGLTGRPPFAHDAVTEVLAAILADPVPPPTALVPGLDPGLEAVLLRALAREPGARFPDVRAFGAALLPHASPPAAATWADVFAPRVDAPTVAATARPRTPRSVVPWGLGLAAVLALAGLALAVRRPRRPAAVITSTAAARDVARDVSPPAARRDDATETRRVTAPAPRPRARSAATRWSPPRARPAPAPPALPGVRDEWR